MSLRHLCILNPPTEFYSPVNGGAVATVSMQLAKEELRRGRRVTVLTRRDGNPSYTVGDVLAVDVRERHELSLPARAVSKVRRKLHGWDVPFYEWYLRSLRLQIRNLACVPDVVIVHNDLVSPRYIAAMLPKAKVLLWMHNETVTHQFSRDLKETISAVHCVVCVSRYIGDWVQRRYAWPNANVAVINNGVDLKQFHPEHSSDPGFPVRVLCLGRIDRNKGADIAVDAVAQLRREGVAIELSVAGGLWFGRHGNEMSDPYFRELAPKMEAAGAKYLGPISRENVPALIRHHDIVCVLSRTQDPNPLVCLESMASGCAVVGSNRGGIPDACGDAGILVDPEDGKAVCSALRRLATDAIVLSEAKKRSVDRASKATWAMKVDEMEALLSV